MKKARDIYDSYLRELRETHVEDESLMRRAIEAFDAIQAGEEASECLLGPIVQAASDSRKKIFDVPVDFLDRLSGKHAAAREAIVQMIDHTKSHVRFNGITCIGKAAPKSFKLKLLRKGLRDSSSKVRSKAADWIGRQRLRELVPDLEDALATEKNADARSTIEFELRLLRDGYILKTESDGTVCVTALTPKGCGSRWFEQIEIDRRGIEAIIAEFASDLIE